jgi:hypothetical protein
MGVTIAGRLRGMLNLATPPRRCPGRPSERPSWPRTVARRVAAAAAAWTRRRAGSWCCCSGDHAGAAGGPSYFQHYASFPAPFLALVVGIGCGVLLARPPSSGGRGPVRFGGGW